MRDVTPDVRDTSRASEQRIFVVVVDDATPITVGVAYVTAHTREFARQVIDHLGAGDLAALKFVADASGGQEFTPDRA